MGWIKEFFLIFIFLCATTLTSKAQQNTATCCKADSLFNNGMYQDAAIEYERQLFFAKDKNTIYNARIRKAECYKMLMAFDKAARCLSAINLGNQNDRTIFSVRNEMAFLYLFNEQPRKALMQLQQLKYRVKSDSLKNLALIPEILCQTQLKNWNKAQHAAQLYINSKFPKGVMRDSIQQRLSLLFHKKHLPKLKNPKKAENLSRFFPGMGQIYCGRIAEGSFTFIFNLSFLALGVHQIYHKFYFTGYTAGFGVLHKTYTGNLSRAKKLAIKTNITRHQKFTQEVSEFLLSLQKI